MIEFLTDSRNRSHTRDTGFAYPAGHPIFAEASGLMMDIIPRSVIQL